MSKSDPSAALQRLKALLPQIPAQRIDAPAGDCVFQPDPELSGAYCLCGWVKSAHKHSVENAVAAMLDAAPVLIEFAESMLAAIPAEHGSECPRKHGYDHMRCRCEKDYMDEAAARLAEGLR